MAVTAETIESVALRVAEGETTQNILEELGIKALDFYRALDKCPDERLIYEQARKVRAETLVDEIISIADTDLDPQRARNRIDVRKWQAGKLIPHTYGDRVDVNISGQVNLVAAIADARARLRPVSDQPEAIDADYSVVSAQIEQNTTDKETGALSVEPAKAPDIFE